jgi:hypothetical protein
MKVIADKARTMKVITVVDMASLDAGKSEIAKDTISQINNFIPDFNFSTDSVLIATKAEYSLEPCHVVNIVKEDLGYPYSESQVGIFYKPIETTGALKKKRLWRPHRKSS